MNVYAMRVNMTIAIMEMVDERNYTDAQGRVLTVGYTNKNIHIPRSCSDRLNSTGPNKQWASCCRHSSTVTCSLSYRPDGWHKSERVSTSFTSVQVWWPCAIWRRHTRHGLAHLAHTAHGTTRCWHAHTCAYHRGCSRGACATIVHIVVQGVTYPALHSMWSHWAPPGEKTRLCTIAFAGSYFGTVVALPLSAALGEHFGWPAIFYVFGFIACLW